MELIARFTKDESGVTAIEYALIAGLVAMVIITALMAVGGSLTAVFQAVSTQLQAAV